MREGRSSVEPSAEELIMQYTNAIMNIVSCSATLTKSRIHNLSKFPCTRFAPKHDAVGGGVDDPKLKMSRMLLDNRVHSGDTYLQGQLGESGRYF